MTIWLWIFLIIFAGLLVPLAWLVGNAVGMERATWGRSAAFAGVQAIVAFIAMKAFPLDFFVLKATAGIFAVLAISPLTFRGLMTNEMARSLLGSFLLTVVSVGGVVLLVIF